METTMNEHVEQLVNYIMKKCLWQFHSRAWDRRRQNEEILTKTKQVLCEEQVDLSTPADRCYWVDAVCMAEAFRIRFPWLSKMGREDIASLMQALHERIDFLTIDGSLNQELTDQHY